MYCISYYLIINYVSMQIHVKVAMNELIVYSFFSPHNMFLFQKFRHCESKVELFVQYNE